MYLHKKNTTLQQTPQKTNNRPRATDQKVEGSNPSGRAIIYRRNLRFFICFVLATRIGIIRFFYQNMHKIYTNLHKSCTKFTQKKHHPFGWYVSKHETIITFFKKKTTTILRLCVLPNLLRIYHRLSPNPSFYIRLSNPVQQ